MGLDAHSDPLIEAIRGLVTADLLATDSDLLKQVYAFEGDIRQLSATNMPALFLYRQSERWERVDNARLRAKVTVAFEYILGTTPFPHRQARWPALQVVWNRIVETLLLGQSANYKNGAAVIAAAGWSLYTPEEIVLERYGYADQQQEAFPGFRGTVLFAANITPDPATVETTVTIQAVQDICGILQDDGTVVPQP